MLKLGIFLFLCRIYGLVFSVEVFGVIIDVDGDEFTRKVEFLLV